MLFAVSYTSKVYAWKPYDPTRYISLFGLFDTLAEEENKSCVNEKNLSEEEKFKQVLQKKLDDDPAIQVDYCKKRIKKMVAGCNFALVLYDSGELFWVQFAENAQLSDIWAFRVPKFKDRVINDIEAGFLHCVALEKEEIPPIYAWTNDRLMNWLNKQGYEDQARIVKYQKIIGK